MSFLRIFESYIESFCVAGAYKFAWVQVLCARSHTSNLPWRKVKKFYLLKGIEPGSPAREGRASSIQPLGLSRREDYILMVSILPRHFRNSSQSQILIITTFKTFEPLKTLLVMLSPRTIGHWRESRTLLLEVKGLWPWSRSHKFFTP